MVSRYSGVRAAAFAVDSYLAPRFRLRRDNLFILSVAEGQVVRAFSILLLSRTRSLIDNTCGYLGSELNWPLPHPAVSVPRITPE